MDVDLGLICAGGHDPVAVFAHAHALTGLVEPKILKKFHAVREFRVVLE